MKIGFARQGENIICMRDYSDIKDSGEVAHLLVELELTKKDLLNIWDEMNSKGGESE